jgi:hypothetical protein
VGRGTPLEEFEAERRDRLLRMVLYSWKGYSLTNRIKKFKVVIGGVSRNERMKREVFTFLKYNSTRAKVIKLREMRRNHMLKRLALRLLYKNFMIEKVIK